MMVTVHQKGPFLRYPLAYLIMALAILYYGGMHETYLISPDGRITSMVYFDSEGVQVNYLLNWKTQKRSLNIPIPEISDFQQIKLEMVSDSENPFMEGIYEIGYKNESFMLEIRQYDGLLTYRVLSGLGSHEVSHVGLTDFSGVNLSATSQKNLWHSIIINEH